MDTVEAWAQKYIESVDLAYKGAPPPPPSEWEAGPLPRRVAPVARPPELRVSLDKPRSMKLGALREPRGRAKLLHKFWHHELQAAELMCWGLLRFSDAEDDFRRGLLRIKRIKPHTASVAIPTKSPSPLPTSLNHEPQFCTDSPYCRLTRCR